MARYEAAVRTTLVTATAGAALVGLRAITRPCWLRELHMFYVTASAASASGLGLNRSTAVGTGTLTGLLGLPVVPTDLAGTAEVVTNWGTAAPTTTAANTLRRWLSGTTTAIGTGLVWVFEPPGIYIVGNAAATSELVLTNLFSTAPGTLDCTFVWDE
jgi:hypothetical protein